MPNCLTASVLFRAYLSRKPSGLLLVTVLSTLLPRPVFRSYPLDIGEAAAVERSVGHAMCALKKCAPSKGQQGDNPCFKTAFPRCHEQHEGYADNVCEHSHALLPAVNVVAAEPLHRALPCWPQHEHRDADEGEEQHAAEGHGEFKQLGGWDEIEHGSPQLECADTKKECYDRNKTRLKPIAACADKVAKHKGHNDTAFQHSSPHGLHQPCQHAAIRSEQQEGADGYAVKQHLRLRVVWQGLLS